MITNRAGMYYDATSTGGASGAGVWVFYGDTGERPVGATSRIAAQRDSDRLASTGADRGLPILPNDDASWFCRMLVTGTAAQLIVGTADCTGLQVADCAMDGGVLTDVNEGSCFC